MFFGIKLKINDRQIAEFDYSKIAKIEGNTAIVNFPSHFIPTPLNNDCIGFDFSNVNLKSIGCEYDAEVIVEEWLKFERVGLPLNEMVLAVVQAEILDFFRFNYLPSLPSWSCFVELVDLLKSCRRIKGFDQKFSKMKKNLAGIIKNFEPGEHEQFLKNIKELQIAIHSWVSEFTIIRNLSNLDLSLRLPSDGYDIEIEGIKAGRVEVKAKLESFHRKLIKDTEAKEDMHFNSLKSELLLSWTAAITPTLEHAFEEQKARIVFVDISTTFSGFVMMGESKLHKLDESFEKALDDALKLIMQNKDAVILFSCGAGSSYRIFARAFERNQINKFGREIVDKFRHDLAKITGNKIRDSEEMARELSKTLLGEANYVDVDYDVKEEGGEKK